MALTFGTVSVLTVLWAAQAPSADQRTGAVTAAVAAVLAMGALVLRRGCRVVVRHDSIADQVAFWTVHRLDRSSVHEVHVASGAWRWFVVELDDGGRTTLVGTGPLQFPARLFDRDHRADLEQIDLLMGLSATE